MVEQSLREHYLAAGYWSTTATLQTRVAEIAAADPERLASVDAGGRRLTYGELDAKADRLAVALRSLGVDKGATVGIQLPNRVEAVIAMCAVERAQAIVCPLMPMYRAKELHYIAGISEMRALFVAGTHRRFDYEALARDLIGEDLIGFAVTLDGSSDESGVHRLGDLLERGERLLETEAPPPPAEPDLPAALMFTSGTTGAPKGVLHSHNTMIAGNRILAPLLDLGENDAVFVPAVIGHGTGYVWGIRMALHLGTRSVLLDIWEPEGAARLLAEQRCTWMMVAPTFVQDLLDASEGAGIDLRDIRHLSCGGSAPPRSLYRRAREQLGCSLLRLYGQTEAFLSTHCLPGDPTEKLVGTEGRALPGVELRVVDGEGNPLPPGEMGSLHARGPHRCIGLLTKDGARRLEVDEWMPSGDLASIDEEGFLAIRGREKEFINRGGFKYSPVEVEDVLLGHPAVQRVAVIAVPDERLGERGCACVVASPGARLELDDITRHLAAAEMAPFKWPERIEIFDNLPKTPSGKVQKHVLQRLVGERERQTERKRP